VRRTARRLGLTTDASYRFERGADPEDCLFSVSRAVELMAEVAGGEIQRGAADVHETGAEWRLYGSIERRRLERFAGVEIPSSEIERILRELGYEPEQVEPDSWNVRVPSWRYYDCEAVRYEDPPTVWEADIYEEVMRHFGFDKIPATLPAIGNPDEGSSATHQLRERMRDHLSAAGLVEAINYGFYDADSDTKFPTLVAGGDAVRVTNPLSENYSLMRRSLLPGLVESGLFNLRRGLEATRLYEIGHLFSDDGTEIETVALLVGGHRGVPWDRGADLDFFTLKGIVDQTAAVFGVELDYRAAELPGIVTGTGAEIFGRVSGERVGVIGQADEEKASVDLFVAELVTGPLEGLERDVDVVAPSKFPAIQADATLTHAVDVPWERLAAAIGESSVEDLIGYGLKDRYEGEGVPRGAVNTTIFFRYNADDRSLTQEEVNDRHMALVEKLETEFGWKP
jgi:phenylalanyl-tRNA synthetase beta chain